ncbi:MAG: hypothetical protein JRH18_15535 [Deltaproteobacteria bacterium]|nr:hypothetical protein [Deltaproteobacteria bacterium]MBW2153069.1 hypothetical protein [Deltaproteobacteria bacterium]
MKITKGNRDLTVYVGFRPFRNKWVERNETVLNALKWQDVEGLKIKFICWPDEHETAAYASENGYACVVVPWYRQYLFPGPQRSFKNMFETILMDCDTEIFVYINGDIVLGPGVLAWIQQNIEMNTLYSLPRHNWQFSGPLHTLDDFTTALSAAIPEEWTAVDLFAMRATDGRKHFIPAPPFLLTAGSMDSWIVAHAGHLGWRRILIPPDQFHMLHIEHGFSHPLKGISSPEKLAKWAFNCGIYETATMLIPTAIKTDTSLEVFEGTERYKFKFGGLPTNQYKSLNEVYSRDDKEQNK